MEHPLRTWMAVVGYTAKDLSKALKAAGRRVDPGYIQTVANGYYPPGRKLVMTLSAITGISLEELINYPYRSKRAA